MNSNLKPSMSTDDWMASARANPASAKYDIVEEYIPVIPGGTLAAALLNSDASQTWLPLDVFAEGDELIHWLSMLGVGYEDGMLHVQMRYNNLFGRRGHYDYGEPVLIDNDGNVITSAVGRIDGFTRYDALLCRGYQEQRFNIGSIDNLKNLRLAWRGNYAENVIEGDWSIEIDLTAIGDSISASSDASSHPDVTGASFSLSPMYFQSVIYTAIDFPDFSLMTSMEQAQTGSVRFWRLKMDEIASTGELAIILSDGTKIELDIGWVFERNIDPLHGVEEGPDSSSGKSTITSWHVLDGSFAIEDVVEVIVFDVSFKLAYPT